MHNLTQVKSNWEDSEKDIHIAENPNSLKSF